MGLLTVHSECDCRMVSGNNNNNNNNNRHTAILHDVWLCVVLGRIIIIEFLTSQLWLRSIHLSWDVVINRIKLGGLICSLKKFLTIEHVPRITDFCSCTYIYVFGCRLSLVRLCDSDLGITPVDDIIIGITCAAFCFHIAHISFASTILLLSLLLFTTIEFSLGGSSSYASNKQE